MKKLIRRWLGVQQAWHEDFALTNRLNNDIGALQKRVTELERHVDGINEDYRRLGMYTKALIDFLGVSVEHQWVQTRDELPRVPPVVEVLKLIKRE